MLIERKFSAPHAVEILRFTVDPASIDRFVQTDHEIWTIGLACYPGFVSKDVWINTERPGEVTTVIYWSSMELWKAIDHGELVELDNRFSKALDGVSFTVEALHDGNNFQRVRQTVLT